LKTNDFGAFPSLDRASIKKGEHQKMRITHWIVTSPLMVVPTR